MKPNEYKIFLKASLEKNPTQAVFVYGGVGIGKSLTTKQIADELGYEFRDIRLSLLDATDLRGLPTIEGNETKWTKPTFLPPEDYDKNILLFFDEFSNAPPSIQNACLQLVLDRQIGEYKLPDSARIVCAGNTLKDGAYVFRLASPLNNRFINIDYEIDFDDWKDWAYKSKINPHVIGFLNFRRELLHKHKEDVDNKSFPTPRSWSFVSNTLDIGLTNGILIEGIKGCVGEGAGTEFYSFMKIYKDLPNPEDILLRNKNIVPKESSQLYALVSALISVVQKHKDKVDRLIEYSNKLPKEFSVLLVKDLLRTELRPNVVASDKFDKWTEENQDVILG